MTTYPQLQDAAWLREQVDAGLTNEQIAQLVGCTIPAVKSALDRNRIYHLRRCSACGVEFTADYYRVHITTCKRKATHATCQHCGNVYAVATHAKHEPRCAQNPAVRELTRRLLDDGNGIIVSSTHYRRVSIGTLAISAPTLRELYGRWADVARAFGLAYGDEAFARQVAIGVANEAAAMRYERRVLAAEMDRGFVVCSARQVGHEVYCMLR